MFAASIEAVAAAVAVVVVAAVVEAAPIEQMKWHI